MNRDYSEIKRPKRRACGSKKIYPFGIKMRCENCFKIYSKELTMKQLSKKIKNSETLTKAIESIYNN